MLSSDIDSVDLYRLSSNASLLSRHAALLHSLKAMNPLEPFKQDDLIMLKTLAQCTIDYAGAILERETDAPQ